MGFHPGTLPVCMHLTGPQGGGAHRLMGKHVSLSQRAQHPRAGQSGRAGDGGPDNPHRKRCHRAALLRGPGVCVCGQQTVNSTAGFKWL